MLVFVVFLMNINIKRKTCCHSSHSVFLKSQVSGDYDVKLDFFRIIQIWSVWQIYSVHLRFHLPSF